MAWLRWDDQKYSPAYPDGWYDETMISYNVKYSDDNKRSWIYAGTGERLPGADGSLQYYLDHFNPLQSVAGGPETVPGARDKSFSWDVAGLPAGNYVLRVEAYRDGFDTGYSYHDIFVTIER